MHENPIIKHSISVRKSVRVFANPIIKHLNSAKNLKMNYSDGRKPYYKTFSNSSVLKKSFRAFECFILGFASY